MLGRKGTEGRKGTVEEKKGKRMYYRGKERDVETGERNIE